MNEIEIVAAELVAILNKVNIAAVTIFFKTVSLLLIVCLFPLHLTD